MSIGEDDWDSMSEDERKELVERTMRLENSVAVEWPKEPKDEG